MVNKSASVLDGFSAINASKITEVPYQTIDYWARTGFIMPSISVANGRGTDRRYDFDDLLALRVARELRKAGASMQALRTVINGLRKKKDNPLAESRLLVVGSDVAVMTDCNEVMMMLRRPGQLAFAAFICDGPKTVRVIRERIKKIERAA